MKRIIFLSIALIGSIAVAAQSFPVDTIIKNGPLNKRINVVYLGDGYLSVDMPKYITDLNAINNQLFNTTPFKEYENYFNVFAIKVTSAEAGIKHTNSAPDCPTGGGSQPTINPKNYFGTMFDVGGIHRLVVPDSFAKISSVLATNFPSYDQVIIVGNSIYYGGSGGTYATSTTHVNSGEITIHEIGHSFAGLADEYWAGAIYAAEKPNMTAQSSPALVKWKNWIGTTNIGVYPYNGGPTWFKPTQNGVCKMEVLNQQFCYVCRETFIEVIHTLISPIEAFTPSNISVINVTNTLGFKLNLIAPVPNTLKRIWTVDGNTAANNVDTFTVLSGSMATGNHTVLATVLDTTAFTRYVNHISLHTYNVQWNLSVTAGGISSSGLDLFKASLKIFPNPFADNLTVEYELDKNSSIGIQLVTAEGKTINLLSEKQQSAGKYSFPLSMKQLATGSYFVVLIINGKRITKELVKLE